MCAQAGIIQEFSTTETPQLNGEAERLMRTLVEADLVLWGQCASPFVGTNNALLRVCT